MKKLVVAALVAILVVLGIGAVWSQASATEPDADNKKVTFCHATGSATNPFVKLETSVMAFYKAGHIDHKGDIWEAFSYTDNKGNVVNVPAQGDTSLLAFKDCQAPKVDVKIAKPEAVYLDPCGTEDDVFSVAPGRGYTVGNTTTDGVTQTITVTLAEGFVWLDGSKNVLTFEKPAFTDVDCDLPNTGGAATYATGAGLGALAGVFLLGVLMLARRRV